MLHHVIIEELTMCGSNPDHGIKICNPYRYPDSLVGLEVPRHPTRAYEAPKSQGSVATDRSGMRQPACRSGNYPRRPARHIHGAFVMAPLALSGMSRVRHTVERRRSGN